MYKIIFIVTILFAIVMSVPPVPTQIPSLQRLSTNIQQQDDVERLYTKQELEGFNIEGLKTICTELEIDTTDFNRPGRKKEYVTAMRKKVSHTIQNKNNDIDNNITITRKNEIEALVTKMKI